MSCASRAVAEPKPDGVHGLDDAVTSHQRQLRPDIADMTIDRAVGDVDIRAIGGDHDLIAAEYDVSTGKEGLENRKLDSSQVERTTIEIGGMLHRSKR